MRVEALEILVKKKWKNGGVPVSRVNVVWVLGEGRTLLEGFDELMAMDRVPEEHTVGREVNVGFWSVLRSGLRKLRNRLERD